MPITRREYESRPYVKPVYEPDTRTLLQLMQMAGRARADAAGQQGQSRVHGLMTLGQILSQGLGSLRQEGERKQAAAFKKAELDRDEQFRRDELSLRKDEREAERKQRERLEQRQIASDERVSAMEAVENTMPGPIDPLVASTIGKYPGTAPLVSQQTTLPARTVTNEIAGLARTADRRRALSGPEEASFQRWYAPIAAEMGLDADPDSPAHLYDYRGAYRAGVAPDESTHWPSTFKQGDHPNVMVDGMDTRTMTAPPSAPTQFTGETMRATPESFAVRGMTPKEERQARIDAQAQADREADNARQLAAANKPAQPTEWSILMQAAGGDPNKALQLRRIQQAAMRESSGTEKPSVWISKGSDMRFVTPSQAASMSAEGWRSGASREQGRPVVSGDANRLADLDTSLDDVEVLTGVLGGTGSTGTSAKVGASLPNWVTELTGRGVSAKQKQATIDRVKQVIGKALEGGVLRKEDERKYEKILPTIYDPPEVVKTKLSGLEQALTQRRQTLLDSLADAGYDTSRFDARTTKPSGGGGSISVTAPDGSVHAFETQAQADAFKRMIGGGE